MNRTENDLRAALGDLQNLADQHGAPTAVTDDRLRVTGSANSTPTTRRFARRSLRATRRSTRETRLT
jgi:hypothetical protein